MINMKDYYEILEVSPKASKEIIERAYHVLVKQYHPDLYTGEQRMYAETKIRDVNEAYKILSDDFLREQYDNEIIKEKEEKESNFYSKTNNRNNRNTKYRKSEKNKSIEKANKEVKIGTMGSILNILKTIFKPRKFNKKKYDKTDLLALGITIGIIVVVGLILWFIPTTNEFLRRAFPLFN